MGAQQALFPMGPLTNAPRPEGVLALGWLQWTIIGVSVALFVLVLALVIRRVLRQRRQPLLHSADERLLRERGASPEVVHALGMLGRERARGKLSEADYLAARARLLDPP